MFLLKLSLKLSLFIQKGRELITILGLYGLFSNCESCHFLLTANRFGNEFLFGKVELFGSKGFTLEFLELGLERIDFCIALVIIAIDPVAMIEHNK